MTRTNMTATRVKPDAARLLTLDVIRRARVSPTFLRVTLGARDIARFAPMGFDQWFRLFLPVSESSLSRLPRTLDTLSYLRYLAISRTERPILRNYSVRAFRHDGRDGAELDVDFVLHGSADGSGPAAAWAQACEPGASVAVIDEGIAYHPGPQLAGRTLLVADESALPAAAGILASLPRDVSGRAVIEVPDPDDVRDLDAPHGLEVTWIVRSDPHATPGIAALAAASALPAPSASTYCWVAGEQALATGMRRHWVQAGVAKTAISFCGYWRLGTPR